jgi:hypothetical protein
MDTKRDAAAAGRSMAGIGVSAEVAEAWVGNAGGRRAAACMIGEPRKEAGRGGMTACGGRGRGWRGRGDAGCEEAVLDAGEGGVRGYLGYWRRRGDEGLRGGVDGMDLGC